MRFARVYVVFAVLFASLTTLSCARLSNPLGKETPELFPIRQNRRWGYINSKGEVVIQPQFEQVWFFSEGLAVACIENDKCGYIDNTGKFAINPQFQRALRFSEGLAAVIIEGKIGYIDKTGKIAINPQFSGSWNFELCTFSEGLARVQVGDKIGFVDQAGKIVINPQFENASPFFDGLAAASIGNKFGFIDKDGKININPQFDEAQPFINGLAAVRVGRQFGYIDKTGKIVINPQFDLAFPFSDEGLALVTLNNKAGFVDKSGKYEINPQFAYLRVGPRANHLSWPEAFMITSDIGRISFSEGLAPAQVSEGNMGYVDKGGKFVINPQFDIALPFYGGMALVFTKNSPGGGMIWVDKEGKYVWHEAKEQVRTASNANMNANVDTTRNNNSSNTTTTTTTAPTNSNMSTSSSSNNERTGRLTFDANLRGESNKDAASMGIHFRGAKVRILDETSYESDSESTTWYKIKVYEYGCSVNANLGCGKNTQSDADEGWVNAKLVLLN